jgi:D-apionate oxidoisomerase
MLTVAVFGAGGKMGTRVTERLRTDPELELALVEADPAARARAEERGQACVSAAEAADVADVTVLAVPDWVIGPVAAEIVPRLRPGALVVTLDPAAAYAGRLPEREDVAYFVTHPTHPPLFEEEADAEALKDYFGSGVARQSIVNALVQGSEEDYALGERLARAMWGPILRSHRVSLEQLAILEPALSETVVGTALTLIREALDEAVALGVPEDAARDFVLGHIRVEAAVIFGEVPFPLSDGAMMAIEDGKRDLLQPDWRKVFELDNVKASVDRITTKAGSVQP